MMGKALVIAYDVIGSKMAGPGLRSLRLAEALAEKIPVTLLIEEGSEPIPGSKVEFLQGPGNVELLSKYDVCLASATFPLTHPWLFDSDISFAVDCYDPYVLENLSLYANSAVDEARFQHERHLKAQIDALMRADTLLCASMRQRDLLTGALMALNRLNPDLVREGIHEDFIRIVPFGIDDPPPKAGGLRGRVDGYGVDDDVLVWAGGIWEWFDPLCLLSSVNILISSRPNIRLHFLGVRHPNRHVPLPEKAKAAMKEAADLGLKDKHVFFSEWTKLDERWKYLVDADIGVSFHIQGFETIYSFRTRLLDYLWAGLPMVVSAGDDLGRELCESGLGSLAETNDPELIAGLIDGELERKNGSDASARFEEIRKKYFWREVSKPLIDFCENPVSTKSFRGDDFFRREIGSPHAAARKEGLKGFIRKIVKPGE